MDKRTKLLIYGAAAYMLISMMALVVKSRKRKRREYEDPSRFYTLVAVGERLAVAIERSAKADDDVPEGLWENMKTLPGFSGAYLSHYYAYLVENPRIARAFHKLDFEDKLIWVARYVSNHFPE